MVLGVPVHKLTLDQVLDLTQRAVASRQRIRLGVVNAAKLVNMGTDPELDTDVRTSDLVLADGMSVVMASRFYGDPLPERVAGIDLMTEMFALGNSDSFSVYLLGAKEEIVNKVAERAVEEHPQLRIAGAQHGYFNADDEPNIVESINASRADALFVAMTSPKKERFMGAWATKLNVPIIHGVGGSFDVYAGKVKRAPLWMQKLGLEWLYRVLQEPGRMWKRYLSTNSAFIYRVVKDRLSQNSNSNGNI